MADPIVHITNGIPDLGTGNITTLGQTLADGANVTLGAIADVAIVAGAAGTINAHLRSISRDLVGGVVLGAGANTIGNVGQAGAPWSQNITQFGSVAISTGTGIGGAGIPRVTVSSDSSLAATQSGIWDIRNITGTVSLPTGASTAAKQPAIGTSGSPAADVLSVQGISGMTALKVDGTGGTFPVTGTVAVTQSGTWNITNISGTVSLPTGAATAAKQPSPSTAGAPSADVLSIQGVGGMTPVKIGLFGNAGAILDFAGQNAAGTISAQLAGGQFNTTPTTITSGNFSPLQLDASGNLLVNIKAGAGSGGTASTFGAAFPSTGTAIGMKDSTGTNMVAFNANASGALKVDGSATTQPVSGTVTANQGGTWTVQPGNTANTTAWLVTGTGGTFPVTQSGTWTNRVVGNAGANLDFAGQNAAGTINALLTGGQFNTSPAAITSGNFSPLQLDNVGNLRIVGTTGRSWSLSTVSDTVNVQQSLASLLNATVSGTVTANLGTIAGVATSANQPTNAAQGSTTSGQTGNLVQGAVTTGNPTYTTGQTSPLSLDTSGALRVNVIAGSGGGGTSSSYGSAFPATGTAIGAKDSAGTNMTFLQVNASNALKVDGSAVTQPVSIAAAVTVAQATAANLNATVTGTVAATQSGNWTSRVVGNAGAVLDFAGQNAAAPANSLLVGGEFNTTPTTITSGNASPLQLDSSGNLKVNIQAGAGSGGTASTVGGALPGQGTLALGSVTTGLPSYTTATANSLSLTTSGLLRVDASTTIVGVNAAQSGTWTVQPGNTANTTAWLVTGTGGTFPVTGTFWQTTQPISAASLPLPTGAATAANQPTPVAIGSTTSGQQGALVFGATTTAAPTYTTAQSNPLSLTTAGGLRVDGSGATQPISGNVGITGTVTVSGTVTANQGGTWTVQPGNTANTTAWLVTGTGGTFPVTGTFWQTTQPVSIAATVNVSAVQSGTWTVQQGTPPWLVGGDVANAAADSGNPVKVGGVGKTTNPTPVADGQRVNALFDKLGKQVTVGSIRILKGVQKTSITTTTETTVVTAGGAGVFNDVYAIVVTNKSATGVFVDFRDATAGTVRMTLAAPANDTRGFTVPVDSAMIQAVAANNWTATLSGAAASIEISMLYVSNL